MPTEFFGQLPQLAALIEKLGVIGLLLIAVAWLVWERMRLMKLSVKTFHQRDRARLREERYRAACRANNITVDVSDIDAIFSEDASE